VRVHSIFSSIDGEVNARGQGSLSTFLRLSQCNLQCPYCDVPGAQLVSSGDEVHLDVLFTTLRMMECPNITITGGEPLLQAKELNELILRFLVRSDKKWNFSIETNGTIAPFEVISPTLPSVSFVVDYKLPSAENTLPVNFSDIYRELRTQDWVKFVICDEYDYQIAVEVVRRHFGQPNKARLAFSPVFGQTTQTTWPKQVAKWMMRDGLWHVNLNVQIHRLLDLE